MIAKLHWEQFGLHAMCADCDWHVGRPIADSATALEIEDVAQSHAGARGHRVLVQGTIAVRPATPAEIAADEVERKLASNISEAVAD